VDDGSRRNAVAAKLTGHTDRQQGTVVDLASEVPFKDGVVVADSALRRGRASLRQLREVLCDCCCRPGIRSAQAVVAFADRKSGSILESVSRVVFQKVGLPAPLTQQKIGDEWEQFGEVDFAAPCPAGRGKRRQTLSRAAGRDVPVHVTCSAWTTPPDG
jgi:hypothetical protein